MSDFPRGGKLTNIEPLPYITSSPRGKKVEKVTGEVCDSNTNMLMRSLGTHTSPQGDFPQGGKHTNHEAKDCRGTASPRGKITLMEPISIDHEKVYVPPRKHTVDANAMASRPDLMMSNNAGHEEKLRGKIANMPHPENKSVVYRGKLQGVVDLDVERTFHQTHEAHRVAEAEKISHGPDLLMKHLEGHEEKHRGKQQIEKDQMSNVQHIQSKAIVKGPPPSDSAEFPQGGKHTNHEAKDCRGTASPRGKITLMEPISIDHEKVYVPPRKHTVDANAMASRPDLMMRNMDGHEEKLRGKIANPSVLPHPETKEVVYHHRGKQQDGEESPHREAVAQKFHSPRDAQKIAETEKMAQGPNLMMKNMEGHEMKHRGKHTGFQAPAPRDPFKHAEPEKKPSNSPLEASNVGGFHGMTKAPEVAPAGRARGANWEKPSVAPYLAAMPDPNYQGYHK